jgi:hypothetical protein
MADESKEGVALFLRDWSAARQRCREPLERPERGILNNGPDRVLVRMIAAQPDQADEFAVIGIANTVPTVGPIAAQAMLTETSHQFPAGRLSR